MAQPVEFDSNSDGSVSAYPEKRPSIKVREPLLSEVLTKVHGAKTKAQKIKILQEEDCLALRQICRKAGQFSSRKILIFCAFVFAP